jgi:hypothetical protein
VEEQELLQFAQRLCWLLRSSELEPELLRSESFRSAFRSGWLLLEAPELVLRSECSDLLLLPHLDLLLHSDLEQAPEQGLQLVLDSEESWASQGCCCCLDVSLELSWLSQGMWLIQLAS